MYKRQEQAAQNARMVLVWVMSNTLKLLHPFMPYITEEIWQSLPHEGEAIMVSKWPEYQEALCDAKAEEDMSRIMEVIRAVRNRRSEMNVPPSRKTHLYLATNRGTAFEPGKAVIAKLAYASQVEIGEAYDLEGAVTIVTSDAKVFIPMDELVDKQAEIARLTKELETAQKQLESANNKLKNEKFISKAPANIVEGAKANAKKLADRVALIESTLQSLQ